MGDRQQLRHRFRLWTLGPKDTDCNICVFKNVLYMYLVEIKKEKEIENTKRTKIRKQKKSNMKNKKNMNLNKKENR